MHWIDQTAENVLDKPDPKVIASGTSISGHIHIGHSKDVFIADAVSKALREKGEDSEIIWYADDIDPLRRIPWPLPEEDYEEYLGMPYIDIPAPESGYDSFVDYFVEPFLDVLPEFGVRPKVYSSSEVYRSGRLVDEIETALEQAEKIRDILNKYRSDPLSEDWLPYDPVCEKCGRIATTRAYDWEDNYVYYTCDSADYVEGCSHEGKADYTEGEGKLTWRVEWPARWHMLDVVCEPFGKDHAADGGSYDTGKHIVREVFGMEPPEPVPYEWISLGGDPMSSSKGRVFTLEEWLEVAEPELLRYFIFRSKALKAVDFDPGVPLLELYQEYRRLEEVYFDREEVSESREEQMKRVYELSQTDDVPDHFPERIPIRLAAIMIQVARDVGHVIEILKRKGVLENPEDWEIELAKERLRKANNWIKKYAPENEKLEILEEVPKDIGEKLTTPQKKFLSTLADEISKNNYGPVEIHNRIFELAEEYDIEPVDFFKAIYLSILGKDHGPRAGNFLTALEDEFVIERFREAAS